MFGNIYIGGHFSWLTKENDLRKSQRSLLVVIVNIMLCLLNVNISVARHIPSDKGQERR